MTAPKFTTPNHRNTQETDDANFYPTPYAALAAFMEAERKRIPDVIWEPCAGNGHLVIPLRNRGLTVHASDLHQWNCPDAETGMDFLEDAAERYRDTMPDQIGIVTNPPFNLIVPITETACRRSGYVAMFARLAFLESAQRMGWFRRMGLRRVHVISERLPMINRHGYEGKKMESSAMAFAWFVFEPGKRASVVSLKWVSWRAAVRRDPLKPEDEPSGGGMTLPLFRSL